MSAEKSVFRVDARCPTAMIHNKRNIDEWNRLARWYHNRKIVYPCGVR